jgi:hypothetical protein
MPTHSAGAKIMSARKTLNSFEHADLAKMFMAAPKGASILNLAERAMQTLDAYGKLFGVVFARLDEGGAVERPPPYSSAWDSPARTSAELRAAFKEESDANAIAIGDMTYFPGGYSSLQFTAPAKRKSEKTEKPARVADKIVGDNSEAALRATIDRVINAGLARHATTNPNVENVMRAAGYAERPEEKQS